MPLQTTPSTVLSFMVSSILSSVFSQPSLIPQLSSWCPPTCPCKPAAVKVGPDLSEDPEPFGYHCPILAESSNSTTNSSNTIPAWMFIEPDGGGHWFLECPLQPVVVPSVANLGLRLGIVSFLAIKDCSLSGGASSSQGQGLKDLLHALGARQVDRVRLIAKDKYSVVADRAFAGFSQAFQSMGSLEIRSQGYLALAAGCLDQLGDSLRELVIHRTSVSSVPKGLLSRATNLENVTIFGNSRLQYLPDDLFAHNVKLQRLDLSMNSLARLDGALLSPLKNLRYLDLGSNRFESLAPGMLEGSCASLEVFLMNMDACLVRSTKVVVACRRRFPPGFLSTCRNLKTFSFSRSGRPPADGDQGTEDLQLFPKDFLANATSLRHLSVTRASLTSAEMADLLSGAAIGSDLDSVDLAGNNVTTVSKTALAVLARARSVRMAFNPFECDCGTVHNLGHLMNERKNLDDSKLVSIRCNRSEEVSVQYGIAEAAHKVCQDGLASEAHLRAVYYKTAASMGILAAVTVALVAAFLSERVKVMMYHSRYLSRLFADEEVDDDDEEWLQGEDAVEAAALGTVGRGRSGEPEKVRYDAFISYADQDSSFIEELLANLEDPESKVNRRELGGRTFRCCVHERDWRAGNSIQWNIVDSVTRSSRTIILMSDAFLASDWCQREFDEAYRQKKLIVILLDEQDDEEDRRLPGRGRRRLGLAQNLEKNPLIQSYMKSHTYIRSSDRRLWQKLAYHLPHRRLPGVQP